jgi:hypothetical protein
VLNQRIIYANLFPTSLNILLGTIMGANNQKSISIIIPTIHKGWCVNSDKTRWVIFRREVVFVTRLLTAWAASRYSILSTIRWQTLSLNDK